MLLNVRQESGISVEDAYRSGQDWSVRKDWFDSWIEDLVLRQRRSSKQSASRESISTPFEQPTEVVTEPIAQQRLAETIDPTVFPVLRN